MSPGRASARRHAHRPEGTAEAQSRGAGCDRRVLGPSLPSHRRNPQARSAVHISYPLTAGTTAEIKEAQGVGRGLRHKLTCTQSKPRKVGRPGSPAHGNSKASLAGLCAARNNLRKGKRANLNVQGFPLPFGHHLRSTRALGNPLNCAKPLLKASEMLCTDELKSWVLPTDFQIRIFVTPAGSVFPRPTKHPANQKSFGFHEFTRRERRACFRVGRRPPEAFGWRH